MASEIAGDVTKVSVELQTSFSGACVLQPDSSRETIASLQRQLQSARKKISSLVADKTRAQNALDKILNPDQYAAMEKGTIYIRLLAWGKQSSELDIYANPHEDGISSKCQTTLRSFRDVFLLC